jgi:hypothetical protein
VLRTAQHIVDRFSTPFFSVYALLFCLTETSPCNNILAMRLQINSHAKGLLRPHSCGIAPYAAEKFCFHGPVFHCTIKNGDVVCVAAVPTHRQIIFTSAHRSTRQYRDIYQLAKANLHFPRRFRCEGRQAARDIRWEISRCTPAGDMWRPGLRSNIVI